MTKEEACRLLGLDDHGETRGRKCSSVISGLLNIDRQTWYNLPDELPERYVNQIIGIATKKGITVDKEFLK